MKLYCNLILALDFVCAVYVGGVESFLKGGAKPLMRYHFDHVRTLTFHRHPVKGQFQAGSLTGAVASQRVTEACKGFLRLVRNQFLECKGIRKLDCETYKSNKDESRP